MREFTFYDDEGRIVQTATLVSPEEADLTVEGWDRLAGWIPGKWSARYFVEDGAAILRPAVGLPAFESILDGSEWIIPDLPAGTEVWVNGSLFSVADENGAALSFSGQGEWAVRFDPPFPWFIDTPHPWSGEETWWNPVTIVTVEAGPSEEDEADPPAPSDLAFSSTVSDSALILQIENAGSELSGAHISGQINFDLDGASFAAAVAVGTAVFNSNVSQSGGSLQLNFNGKLAGTKQTGSPLVEITFDLTRSGSLEVTGQSITLDGRNAIVNPLEPVDFEILPPLVARDDTAEAIQDGPEASGNVLANDGGAGLEVVAIAGSAAKIGIPLAGALGTLTLAADGSFVYVADNAAQLSEGEVGQDIFVYRVTDASGAQATAQLIIAVTGIGQPTISVAGSVVDRGGNELSGTTVTFLPDHGGSSSLETSTDGRFLFELSPPVAGEMEFARAHGPGDPEITTASALEALRIAVGLNPSWGPAEPMDFIAADFNGDGQVTTADALGILRVAVGLPAEQAPRWLFVESEADLSGINRANTQFDPGLQFDPATTSAMELNLTGILVGHVQEYA